MFAPAGAVASVTVQLVAFQALSITNVNVINVQAIGDDTAVDIGFIKNCARQTRFTTGNVRHRVEQMGRKADACAETDFGFFDRCIG